MQVARQGKMLEGGVGGSIAPTAVSTLKRSGKMCARGVERGTNGTLCARVERNGTTSYKTKFHLMQFLHMAGMVLSQVQMVMYYGFYNIFFINFIS